MSIFKIALKQHTPLIHFQTDQAGATLRASDVKNRLNMYLPEGSRYQLKILAENTGLPREPRESNLLYFGNLTGIKPKFSIHAQDLELTCNTYFDEELGQRIRDIIPKTFALHNFGTRSSKGSGGYFPKKDDGSEYSRAEFERILKNNSSSQDIFFYELNNITEIKDVFFSIQTFYSLLKSGINMTGRDGDTGTYYKSLLFLYLENTSDTITWEKRKIKEEFNWFFGKRKPVQHLQSVKKNTKFVRALLGTGESQKWNNYSTLTIGMPDGFNRFPSPIQFKVYIEGVNTRVYFWVNDFYKEYLDKTFTFSGNGSFQLNTPASFDLNAALKYILSNFSTLVPINNNNGNDAQGLVRRYDKQLFQLKEFFKLGRYVL